MPSWKALPGFKQSFDVLDSPQALIADYEQFGETLLHYLIHRTLADFGHLHAR